MPLLLSIGDGLSTELVNEVTYYQPQQFDYEERHVQSKLPGIYCRK
jgi:hypothetical protein